MDEQQFAPLQQSPADGPLNASLPKATDIFKQAWTIYKKRLGFFLSVTIIPMAAIVISWATLSGAVFLQDKISSSVVGFLLLVFAGLLLFTTAVIIQAWGQTALLYAIKDHQENIGVKEAYRRGWPKIISYWWVNALTGFIIMGGLLLFVAPGIIFAVWFSLAMFILIAEDTPGMNALLKSREYMRGKWGAVFLRYLFIGLISLVYFLAPIFIFMILGVFLKIPFKEEILQLVAGALNLFWAPLITIYSFLIYEHLKALKGQIAIIPAKGKKAGFVLLAIFGFLIVPIIIFTMMFMLK